MDATQTVVATEAVRGAAVASAAARVRARVIRKAEDGLGRQKEKKQSDPV
jgi:hypothetical protein